MDPPRGRGGSLPGPLGEGVQGTDPTVAGVEPYPDPLGKRLEGGALIMALCM